ncbi:MAG: Phage portal or tail protein (ACLAME 11), partial [uncultured Gemmatimonadetes bacterium]
MPKLALHRLLGLALLTLVPVSAHAQQAAQAAPLRGDVNGDGRVTAADAQAVRDHVAGRPAAPGIQLLPNGDANGDGRITGVDAAMIQAFAAGRDVSRFGVGQPIKGSTGTGEGKKGENMLALYTCTVDVESGAQRCETPRPEMGASADILMGKPFITYTTTGGAHSRGNPADEDTTSFNVAVTNNIGQPIGTVDGTTLAATGIRVFFHDGPRVTVVRSGVLADATIRLDGIDGNADFAGPEGEFARTNKPFYRYSNLLATGATSPAKGWKFIYSSNTRSFTYSVMLSAPVQYEFGLVTLSPTSLVLGEGEASAALTSTVRDVTFATVGDGITWSSSDPAVATVDASGAVTGVAQGTATITATSVVKAQRKGSIPVTVDKAPTLDSTTPADNATQ